MSLTSGSATSAVSLPSSIEPMLASLARQPFDSPDHIFELKWDGVRALAFISEGSLTLQGRNARAITQEFPELAKLPQQVSGDGIVLDGELVCLDDAGQPSFPLLQQRLRASGSARRRRPQVHFIAFDLLYFQGQPVMDFPLTDRKNMLHQVLTPSDLIQATESIEADGKALFQATCDLGLEGIVAKEKSSLYVPGRRSPAWVKIKRIRDCEFIIGGYSLGGGRKELFTSLLLGLHDDDGRLVYVGSVNSGFADSEAKRTYEAMRELHVADCPFQRPPSVQQLIYWCRPEMVCQVQYGEFTTEGLLRYPHFTTLREDKTPQDCAVADAPGWPQSIHGEE
jgi:DNA ligase D-like protein (predicted ligase)